jgi:hypothetical protein
MSFHSIWHRWHIRDVRNVRVYGDDSDGTSDLSGV